MWKHKIISIRLYYLKSYWIMSFSNPLIMKLLHTSDPICILICWIQSHIGVSGNERADTADKSVLDLDPNKFMIPNTDLKLEIKSSGLIALIISSSKSNPHRETGDQRSENPGRNNFQFKESSYLTQKGTLFLQKKNLLKFDSILLAQSARAIEYTDWISGDR